MTRISILVMGVALATLFFTFLVLTASAGVSYSTVTQTTLEHFNAGELYHTGLTRSTGGGGDGDGEVRLLVVGIAGEWYTDTNTTGLPKLFGHAAVQHNGYIYVIGGHGDSKTTSHVYYSSIVTTTHDLTDWQETTPMSSTTVYTDGVYHHGAAVVNDRIYVVGGTDHNVLEFFDTVCSAPINPDGTLGAWSTTEPLPNEIYSARMVAVNDRLYVLGGQQVAAPTALNTVYYAEPDPETGAISAGGWITTTALPNYTFGHMVATWGDRIYVLGGTLDGFTFYPYVNYATPLTTTGAIAPGGWMTTTNMKHNIYGGAAAAVYGELFTTGGAQNNNSTPSAYVGATLIDLDGSVGAWVDTSLIVPERFFHAVVASNDGWLYVIGGAKFGGTPIETALVNRGATAGEDARSYAPDGDFTSSRIDLGQDRTVTHLFWNTFISDTSVMTVALSYRLRPHGGAWGAWQGPYPSAPPNGNVTTTVSISTTARYLQYMAFFSTTVTTRTPVLNWVRFKYIVPNPDLQLTKDDARDVVHLGDVITYTFHYTNTGGVGTLAYITETVPAHTAPYGLNEGWQDVGGNRYRYSVSGVVSPTQSGEVTFVVQVDSQVPDGTSSIYNRAVIGGQGEDENPEDNEAEHTTALNWIDLRLSLSDGITITRPGEMLTYTIAYTNGGSVNATGSVLTLTIPEHTAPCGDNTGWTAVGGRQYTRDLGAIAPGGPYEVTFTVCVDDPVDPGVTSLEATATIADDGSNGSDPVPADNTDTDTDAVSRVDLVAYKTDGLTLAYRDQTLLYTITVTNVGNATLDGMLYLTETLPLNTTYVNAGYGWSGADRTWTKSMAVNLSPGASATTYMSVHTSPIAPLGPITNTVTAWTPGVLHPDLGTAHDVDIIVEGAPSLVVEISDGVTAFEICQVLVYTIQCHNHGNETATSVMLTATLPTSMTYVGTGWQDIGGGRYTHAVPHPVEPSGGYTVTFSTALVQPASLSRAVERSADRALAPGDHAARSPDDWPDQIVQTVSIGCAELEDPAGNVATDVNALRRPDLHVVSITADPAPACVNQPTTFHVVIGNSGDAPVANDCCQGFWTDLYVNPPHQPGANEYSNVDVAGWVVNVGENGTWTVDLVYTFQTLGTFTIYAQANPDRYWDIPESDFENNTSDPLSVTVVEKCRHIYLPLVVKSSSP